MTDTNNTPAPASSDAGTEVVAKISSLAAARKEQAALRKQAKESHPAGTEQAEPPKANDKPAAKKSTTSPAKAAPVIKGTKLRWTKVDDSDAAVALTQDGSYSLLPHEGKWKVELRVGKKVTVLVSGVGRTAAYKVAVHHNKTGEVPAVLASA